MGVPRVSCLGSVCTGVTGNPLWSGGRGAAASSWMTSAPIYPIRPHPEMTVTSQLLGLRQPLGTHGGDFMVTSRTSAPKRTAVRHTQPLLGYLWDKLSRLIWINFHQGYETNKYSAFHNHEHSHIFFTFWFTQNIYLLNVLFYCDIKVKKTTKQMYCGVSTW